MIAREPVGTDRLLGGKGLEGLDFETKAAEQPDAPSETTDGDLRIRGLDLREHPRNADAAETEQAASSG